MSLIKIAPIGRQARVVVNPQPTTLAESSAILRALQKLGPVSVFLNPRYVPALQQRNRPNSFLAIFSESDALERACQAGPMSVEVGHDELEPAVEDPFNIRRLASRTKVERRTFTCEVVREEDPTFHKDTMRQSPYYGAFVVDKMAPSYQDLTKQAIPSAEFAEILQGKSVAVTTHGEQDNDRGREREPCFGTKEDVGLMATWREAVGKRGQDTMKVDSVIQRIEGDPPIPLRKLATFTKRPFGPAKQSRAP